MANKIKIQIFVMIFVFLLAGCKSKGNEYKTQIDSRGETSEEWKTNIKNSNPYETKYMSIEDSMEPDGPGTIHRLNDRNKLALVLKFHKNNSFYGSWNYQPFDEWTVDGRSECKFDKPNIVSERVWVRIAKPFFTNKEFVVECNRFRESYYDLSENIKFICGATGMAVLLTYDEGYDSGSSTFEIPEHLRTFFFLPYIRENRDWVFEDRETALNVADDVVERTYVAGVGYSSDDIGELRKMDFIFSNDLNRSDKVTFEYQQMRLHRKSVLEGQESSTWYRPSEPNSLYKEINIYHVEPLDDGLIEVPKAPTMHARGGLNYDDFCWMMNLPR